MKQHGLHLVGMTAAKGKAAVTYFTTVLQSRPHMLFNQMYLLLGYTGIGLPLVVVNSRKRMLLTLIIISSGIFSDGNISSQAIELRVLTSNAFLPDKAHMKSILNTNPKK